MAKKKNDNKLEKAVNAIVSRLEKAENFVLEQAPDVCKEVVKEKLVLSIFNAGIFVSAAIASSRLSFYLFSCAEGNMGYIFGGILGGGVALGATISAICNLETLISVKTAPKLTILRELKSLTEKDEE